MYDFGPPVSVSGVTFEGRQIPLRQLFEAQGNGAVIHGKLWREPDNVHDSNAILVVLWCRGRSFSLGGNVGYIPKETAAKLAPLMDKGEEITVKDVRIVGGDSPNHPHYGVRLQLQSKEAF